jgi:hypothetical protein
MSEKKLKQTQKKSKNYAHYPKNSIIKEIMIATNTPNLTDFAERLGLSYATVSNWNNRNKITQPQTILRAYPTVNPEFAMFGTYPVLREGTAISDASSGIIDQLMIHLNVSSVAKLSEVTEIKVSLLRNWIKVKTIPGAWYGYLRKKYPEFFAAQELEEATIVQEPQAEYKKEVVNHALLEVIADQKRTIAALEKKLKGPKK